MTTNCIQEPQENYENRIFTCGHAGRTGITHIPDRNVAPVIAAALAAPGFAADGPNKTILVGGCDGARSGRDYYTDFAESVPADCVILTLACGKYRFNKLDFGTIGGIPRRLDIGQCNDAYSAIQIAVARSKAFNYGVNDLPLSLVLSRSQARRNRLDALLVWLIKRTGAPVLN